MNSKMGKEIFSLNPQEANSDSESSGEDEEEGQKEESRVLGKRESSTVLTPVKSNRKKVKQSLSGKKSVTAYNVDEEKDESISYQGTQENNENEEDSLQRTPRSSKNKHVEVYQSSGKKSIPQPDEVPEDDVTYDITNKNSTSKDDIIHNAMAIIEHHFSSELKQFSKDVSNDPELDKKSTISRKKALSILEAMRRLTMELSVV